MDQELQEAYSKLDAANKRNQILWDENNRLKADCDRAVQAAEKAIETAKFWKAKEEETRKDVATFVRFIYKILDAIDYKNLMEGGKVNFGRVTKLVFSLMQDSKKLTEPLKEDLPGISILAEKYKELWDPNTVPNQAPKQ